MLGVFVVFVPTLILTGGISGATVLLSQDILINQFELVSRLDHLSSQTWLFILSAALLLLVLSTASSWVLQAAAMRASIMAADGAPVSLRGVLSLGRQRFGNILKLSLVFGFVLAVLALLPALLDIIFRGSPAGSYISNATHIGLLPLNTILGVVVLLVLMSVALEEVTPAASFRRSWRVFKTGWWGFLLVMAATLVLSAIPVVILAPLVFIGMVALVVESGWLLLLAAALILTPLSLAASLFSAVFTLVMYTLIYRASARLADVGNDWLIPARK